MPVDTQDLHQARAGLFLRSRDSLALYQQPGAQAIAPDEVLGDKHISGRSPEIIVLLTQEAVALLGDLQDA